MHQPEAAIPTLEYSRILYEGEFRFRSANTGVAAVLCMLMSAAFCMAFFDGFGPLRYIWLVGLALTGGASAYLWWMMLADGAQRFTISTDGIVAHGRLTRWPSIARFGAYGEAKAKSVRMYFVPAPIGPVIHLQTTPHTTPADYERLIALLEDQVVPLYPNLKVGGYQTES